MKANRFTRGLPQWNARGSIVVLAMAFSIAGTASAQSSISLFGAVDVDFTRGSGSIANKTQISSSGLSSSKLGMKGTENLGGGLLAGFWLESGFGADSGVGQSTNTNNQTTGVIPAGGLTFNRRSHVSIGGDWGEIRLGRDYTPQFWNQDDYDPFATIGNGANQVFNSAITGITTVRASNAVEYLYGMGFNNSTVAFGPDGSYGKGFYLHAMYYVGENASNTANSKDGSGYGVRAGYSTGPITFSGAVGKTHYAAGDVSQNNVGANYDFGFVNAMGMYEWDKNGSTKARGFLVGAAVPVGLDKVRMSYSQYRSDAATNPAAKKWAVGYIHNLSKRTAMYASYAHVKNEGSSTQALDGAATAAGGSSSGYEVGLRHYF